VVEQEERSNEMEFRLDAKVFTADNRQIGQVDRVVLDPKTKQVTDIVVRKGLIFTEDKVVPTDLVAGTRDSQVILREDVEDLQTLPDFQEEYYVIIARDEMWPDLPKERYPLPLYYYPTISEGAPTPYGRQETVKETERNIPEGTVALQEGAQVFSADGKHIGDVERVFIYPRTDHASHFLISKGLLLKERKVIPVAWISTIEEDKVHLAVRSRLLERLREYQA
jgi:uncharacterized protein YrrD